MVDESGPGLTPEGRRSGEAIEKDQDGVGSGAFFPSLRDRCFILLHQKRAYIQIVFQPGGQTGSGPGSSGRTANTQLHMTIGAFYIVVRQSQTRWLCCGTALKSTRIPAQYASEQ